MLREHPHPVATDGEIAAINLESARRRAWARFADDARGPGFAEAVLDAERLSAHFLGDLDAFDRMQLLTMQFAYADDTSRAALIYAEVACLVHRFDDARGHLEDAVRRGAPDESIERQSLTIDQACRVQLDAVLAARRRIASAGRLEDLVPLGALLADLERFAEADDVYRRGLASYDGVSPFPLAWVGFQLGMLWGERVPAPDLDHASSWYQRAIAYLPAYVKARVHLAEIYVRQERAAEAEAVLLPALSSRDPEVRLRLADALAAQGRLDEAASHLEAARRCFDALRARHPLAFEHHAAQFDADQRIDQYLRAKRPRFDAWSDGISNT